MILKKEYVSRRFRGQALNCLVLICVALSLSCGGSVNTKHFSIVGRPNALTVDRVGRLSVTAQCLAGEQLLGGGYYAQYSKQEVDSFVIHNDRPPDQMDSFIIVEASYPSAPTAWTVTIFNRDDAVNGPNNGLQMFAEAYCLTTPGLQVGMQTIQSAPTAVPATQATAVQAQCAPGSTLTGNGFRLDNPRLQPRSDVGLYNDGLMTSAPLLTHQAGVLVANGWRLQEFFVSGVGTPPPTMTVYVLCATAKLTAASPATANIYSDTHTGKTQFLGPQAGEAQCSSNEFSTGGGFDFGGTDPNRYFIVGRFQWQNTAIANFTKWHLDAFWGHNFNETATLQVWALCVKIPPVDVTVKITNPANNSSFLLNPQTGRTNPITFSATATDAMGNPLTGTALKWTVDGAPLGTGQSFQATVSAGVCGDELHKITVVATDSAGHQDADSIDITAGRIC